MTPAQMTAAAREEDEQRDYINQYLKHKRLPDSLRRRILEFYRFAGIEQTPPMLSQLPSSLHMQLQLFMNRTLFLQVAFFKGCEAGTLGQLMGLLKQEYTSMGFVMVHEGQTARGLFMISRGFVACTRHGLTKALLTSPHFFGEESLDPAEVHSHLTVTTSTLSHFMFLERQKFLGFLEGEPRLRDRIHKYVYRKEDNEKTVSQEQLDNVKRMLGEHGHLMTAHSRKHLNGEIAKLEREMADAVRPSRLLKRAYSRSNNAVMHAAAIAAASAAVMQENSVMEKTGMVVMEKTGMVAHAVANAGANAFAATEGAAEALDRAKDAFAATEGAATDIAAGGFERAKSLVSIASNH
jgi:CRP-like cAMP-binding protein